MNTRSSVRILLAASTVLAATALPGPAAAAPGKKKTGTVAVTMDRGCTVKLIGPGTSKKTHKATASTTLRKLAPGKYRVVAKPGTCKAQPATIRVRAGKKARVRIVNDPRTVPSALIGTFSGVERTDTQTLSWTASIRLETPTVAPANPAYAALGAGGQASYRAAALSGTWTIAGGVDGGCTYSGSGQLGLSDLLPATDGRGGDAGYWWTNPWNDYTYAFQGRPEPTKQLRYTATCPQGFEGTTTRQETRLLPVALLQTNAWSGVFPQAPLPKGLDPQGSYTLQRGGTTTTWTWDLEAGPGNEAPRPS